MEQGTKEWHDARIGRITASRFADVMTKSRSGDALGQTAESYLNTLIAETISGNRDDTPTTKAMEWGTEYESRARNVYESIEQVTVTEVGFIQLPNSLIGCSPDGLVGDDGGLEIKCPYTPKEHMKTFRSLTVPKQYVWQVVGAMFVTGRQWWDFVSYDPRMPDGFDYVRVRVHRDEKQITELRDKLLSFESILKSELEGLINYVE